MFVPFHSALKWNRDCAKPAPNDPKNVTSPWSVDSAHSLLFSPTESRHTDIHCRFRSGKGKRGGTSKIIQRRDHADDKELGNCATRTVLQSIYKKCTSCGSATRCFILTQKQSIDKDSCLMVSAVLSSRISASVDSQYSLCRLFVPLSPFVTSKRSFLEVIFLRELS